MTAEILHLPSVVDTLGEIVDTTAIPMPGEEPHEAEIARLWATILEWRKIADEEKARADFAEAERDDRGGMRMLGAVFLASGAGLICAAIGFAVGVAL